MWTLLFGAWYVLRVDDFPSDTVAAEVTGVKVLVLALLVYTTNYLLIPRLLYEKRYWLFGIVFLVLVTGAGFFKLYLIIRLLQPYFRVQLRSHIYQGG